MRTSIVLDDNLVKCYANVSTKRELVELALREFVQNHRRKIQIDPDYDYKKLREKK